ncbi:MAG: NAD(P)(+) transhydrogenase (Re/Si-specific) subunit beta [Clostridiales bacterium]|nr:NAD(P)(+) transhydrogenase (Re/Si-specific) subunit beta [Clostridiales bacterium]
MDLSIFSSAALIAARGGKDISKIAGTFGVQDGIAIVLYIAASILFVLGIKKLGKATTARQGNFLSAIGMGVAVLAVLIVITKYFTGVGVGLLSLFLIIAAIGAGSVIGILWSKKVEMTGMPELVALFNGFGGLASLLVAQSQFCAGDAVTTNAFDALTLGLTIAIGAVAFTGSIVAWGKLSGKMFKGNIQLPYKNVINGILCGLGLLNIILYMISVAAGIAWLGVVSIIFASIIFLALGVTLVICIGGGDMPVIISFLNALSGLAAAFAGFPIKNTVLIVSGCLVGASGVILTLIMCKAMNRKFFNLLFKSFGAKKSTAAAGEAKEPVSMSIEDAFLILEAAKSVVIVPGYGMAVAQAQHAVKELCDVLEENGCEVNFAIHPVAGRMPGHMNVLLAEANVPYEQLKTSDEINPQMSNVDVAIVIGANDVVNPAAINDESSPLYGMPIVNAYEARTVFVLKRGKGTGFSGIENPLFTNENTIMIYGDAKQTVSQLVVEFEN